MSLTRVRVLLADGEFGPERLYSLSPADAVVAAQQQDQGNWSTWNYPLPKEVGVKPSNARPDVSILDTGERFYAGFPIPT